MKQIKKNENVGRQIEEIVRQKCYPNSTLPYSGCSRGPYDIEDEQRIVEVKACKVTTKNFERNGKQFQRPGRFYISITAHEKFIELAQEKNKTPEYVFVLYEQGEQGAEIILVNISMQSWQEINRVLSSVPRFKRNDGLNYSLISHTKIFTQKRL